MSERWRIVIRGDVETEDIHELHTRLEQHLAGFPMRNVRLTTSQAWMAEANEQKPDPMRRSGREPEHDQRD